MDGRTDGRTDRQADTHTQTLTIIHVEGNKMLTIHLAPVLSEICFYITSARQTDRQTYGRGFGTLSVLMVHQDLFFLFSSFPQFLVIPILLQDIT